MIKALKRLGRLAVLAGGAMLLSLFCSEARPLRYVGMNLSGAEYSSSKMARWRTKEVYPDRHVVDYFADRGMNIIRLPVNWERLQPQLCGPLVPESIAKIDATVALAQARGMVTIVDLHEFGLAHGKLIVGDGREAHCLANLWGKLAAHYRGRKQVWLGIMNEPHDQKAAQWLPAINLSLAAIRKSGFRDRVLVAGTYWSDVVKWVGTDNEFDIGGHIVDPENNYLLELHYYFNPWAVPKEKQHARSAHQGIQDFAPVTRWARAHQAKLFLGETGVSTDPTSLEALNNTLDYMERNGDVWEGVTYFAFGGGPAGFSVYIDKPEPSPQMRIMMRHVPRATPAGAG